MCDRCHVGIMRRLNARRLEMIRNSPPDELDAEYSVHSIECEKCAHVHHRVLIVQGHKLSQRVIEADFIE